MPYLVTFLAALFVSALVTPSAIRVATRWGILALPGGRRQHAERLPKLGGIPLLVAFLIGVAVVYWLLPPVGDDALRLQGVVLGGLIVFVGGLADDRWDLSPWWQFAIQFAGSAIAMAHIIFIEVFTSPITGDEVWIKPRSLALFFSLLWMVGMINTVNWLDGLDGLASGVGTIAALLFAWHSYRLGQEAVAAFPLALAGALIGFLPYNLSPSKIFLGTSGAYFLGYNLATLAILSPAKIATALLVMAVPIIDGLWRVVDRMRLGRSPLLGDRGHLHFRLADAGLSPRMIVLSYYGLSLVFGLVAIFASGLTKLVLLSLLGLGVLIFLIGFSSRRKQIP